MTENTPSVLPAKIHRSRKISPFWLLPIIAFVIGAILFFQILKQQGQTITIRFNKGDGITAGKTAIRYQGLQIGQVKKVYFVDNLKQVEVEAEIHSEAKSILREGTKFWLVKPSASLAGVSGLDALVSGNYITLLPADIENPSQYEFIAEDELPAISVADGDLLVKLITNDLGSITVGANVYYRKVPVGSIADYRFTADQKKIEIDLIIEKKYANLVKKESHFWNISGINVEASLASGVTISVNSLASIVQGAIAFDSPNNGAVAEQGDKFQLYDNVKSAQRGKEIQITLPAVENLKVNETPVFYQNVQIGILSHLEEFEAQQTQNEIHKLSETIKGTLLIDPNHTHLLRSHSQILLKEPRFQLNKEQISKMSELLRGVYFEIEAGDGDPKFEFAVQKESDYLLSRPNTLAFTLKAEQSYGVDQGQGVYYNDIKIGEVLERNVSLDEVSFQVVIFPQYRHLISGESQFVAISNLDVSVGIDGLRVHAGSPADWLKGGVQVLPHKKKTPIKNYYPLYKNNDYAKAGIASSEKTTTLTLTATELSGIDKGAVILYQDFPIGEVIEVQPRKNTFLVSIFIEPKYRQLLSETSRFWIEPALKATLSAQGLDLKASPIMRTLKGAISVDNQGVKGNKTLYSSFEKANSSNTYITLIAKDASKLSRGMPIKYMGLTIGSVESLQLDVAKKQVKLTAYIDGKYHALLAKSGSKFSAISPTLDTTGFKNLDAALQNYINVELGYGEYTTQFSLSDTETVASEYANGFPIIIETSNANGITPQAPVLYRGMQVGIVQQLDLSELGDRILIYLRINPKYKHLVRKNTQFWQASGYTLDIGLSGASISSGTMSQLLNGGISFATPSGEIIQPQAEANRRFVLQRNIPAGAQTWHQGAAE